MTNLEGLSSVGNYMVERQSEANSASSPEEAKELFFKFFIKAMLKETVMPESSIGGEDSFFPKALNQDFMIDKFAETLAKSNKNMLKGVIIPENQNP